MAIMNFVNGIINFYYRLAMVINVTIVGMFVFSLVYKWMLFEKAGQGGWKNLIPFYGSYTHCKIARFRTAFWLRLVLGLAVIGLAASIVSDIAYDMRVIGGFFITDSMVTCLIAIGAIIVVMSILRLVCCIKMAIAFDINGFFGLGLWLLPIIFYPIIAFSGSIQYERPAIQHKGRYAA